MTSPWIDTATRISIWLSLLLWSVGLSLLLLRQAPWRKPARLLWTLGFGCFVVHVAAAYHGFYHWSQVIALAETARQTEAVTGLRTSVGLWVNFVFGAVWLADLLHWWLAGDARHAARPRGIGIALHALMAFMVVNGAIVFVAPGPARGLGIFLVLLPAVILTISSLASAKRRANSH